MVGGAIGRVLELLPIKGWLALTRSERQVALLSHEPNRDLGELAALVEQGALTPVIDSVFPLREAPEAMRRFIRGEVCGKAILAIGEPPA